MGNADRQFISFFGVELDDWTETFGTFASTHYFMLREYESDACSWVSSSEASDTHKFLYPFDIERIYFLEGTAKGQIVLFPSTCTSTVTDYRVTICKVHEDNTETELGSTGWRNVNDTITWNTPLSIPDDEIVYPFKIHISPERKLTEKERLFLKIEVHCNYCTHLGHANDATWEDVRIDIPFKGI